MQISSFNQELTSYILFCNKLKDEIYKAGDLDSEKQAIQFICKNFTEEINQARVGNKVLHQKIVASLLFRALTDQGFKCQKLRDDLYQVKIQEEKYPDFDALMKEIENIVKFENLIEEIDKMQINELERFLGSNPHFANARSFDYKTLLCTAAGTGYLQLVQMLVTKFQCDVNLTDGTTLQLTPLHEAVKVDALDIFRFLIENGADFRVRNSEGFTPVSAGYQKPKINKYLMSVYQMNQDKNNQQQSDLIKQLAEEIAYLIPQPDDIQHQFASVLVEKQQTRWSYIENQQRSYRSFNEAQNQILEQMCEEFKEDKYTVHLNQNQSEHFVIDLNTFSGQLTRYGKETNFDIMCLGKPPVGGFKKHIKQIEWQFRAWNAAEQRIEILDCQPVLNNTLTNYLEHIQGKVKVECEFFNALRAQNKTTGELKESNQWSLQLNFAEFKFESEVFRLSGSFRWLPARQKQQEAIKSIMELSQQGRQSNADFNFRKAGDPIDDDPADDGDGLPPRLVEQQIENLKQEEEEEQINQSKILNKTNKYNFQQRDQVVFFNKQPLYEYLLAAFQAYQGLIQQNANDIIVIKDNTIDLVRDVNNWFNLVEHSFQVLLQQYQAISKPKLVDRVVDIIIENQNQTMIDEESINLKIKNLLGNQNRGITYQVERQRSNTKIRLNGPEETVNMLWRILQCWVLDTKQQMLALVSDQFAGLQDLYEIINDTVVLGKRIACVKQQQYLEVTGTPQQLQVIRENIEHYMQILQNKQDNEITIEKIYDGASSFADQISAKTYFGNPVNVTPSGQDLKVQGTRVQLKVVEDEINNLKQEEKINSQVVKETYQKYGHLANLLNNIPIDNQQIKAIQNGDDLEIECKRGIQKLVAQLLPQFQREHECKATLNQFVTELGKISEDRLGKLFRVRIIDGRHTNLVMLVLNKIINSKQEFARIADQKIIQQSSLAYQIKSDLVLEIKFEGTQISAAAVQEEVQRMNEITKTFLEHKNQCIISIDAKINKYKQMLINNTVKECMRHLWSAYTTIYQQRFNDILKENSVKLSEQINIQYAEWLSKEQQWPEDLAKILNITFEDFYTKNVHPELENLKQLVCKQQIDGFKQTAILECEKNGKKISKEDIDALNNLIKKAMDNNLRENIATVPKTLYCVNSVIQAFKLQLKIFYKLPEFFDLMEKHKTVLVRASTGTGKSSMLPALILAMGYKRVVVTQPRRLPCKLISQRVNSTFDKYTSGWVVSGVSKNNQNPLIYMTDGMLKETIIYCQKMQPPQPLPYNVIMLDEVHERGRNVDLCIALLSLKISDRSQNFKIVLCSATIDREIQRKFEDGINKVGVFEMILENRDIIEKNIQENHPIHIAHHLSMDLNAGEQLLVFLPSVIEVKNAVELFKKEFKKPAYGLYSNQLPSEQAQAVQKGQIFFSTTIAETSLTFPNLRFVIDSGKIRAPVYNYQKQAMEMKELPAPISTLTQRKGRLGRLGIQGIYIQCTDSNLHKQDFHDSELLKLNITDIYFGLLKNFCDQKNGYNGALLVEKCFSRVPTIQADLLTNKVILARKELIQMKIIENNQNLSLTPLGIDMVNIPMNGETKMLKALHAALSKYKCGQDLIVLASFCFTSEQALSTILKNVPLNMIKESGDFETLISLMNTVISQYQSLKVQDEKEFENVCKTLNINQAIHRLIWFWYKKIVQTQKAILQSPQLKQYHTSAYQKSASWEMIAKSILEGYGDHGFVNFSLLGGDKNFFLRLNSDKQIHEQDLHITDQSSKLNKGRKLKAADYIIAKNIFFNELQADSGIVSLLGVIKPEWLEKEITCTYRVGNVDFEQARALQKQQYQNNSGMTFDEQKGTISIKEKWGEAVKRIVEFDQGLRYAKQEYSLDELIKKLIAETPDHTKKQLFQQNYDQIKDSQGSIFFPLFYRYANKYSVKIYLNKSGVFVVENANKRIFQKFKQQIDTFIRSFRFCHILRQEDYKVPPRPLDRKKIPEFQGIETRIGRVTDPSKTQFELKEYVEGSSATRVTRMELVSWILINKFDCLVEGGFVRDWIVRGNSFWPSNIQNPLKLNPYNGKEEIDRDNHTISPRDLDVQLPISRLFDPIDFKRQLKVYGITCEIEGNDFWRLHAIFDRNAKTGPFTADLIEPFTHSCHDMIDMDVSNLYVKSGYTKDLGMRIPLEKVNFRNKQGQINISLEDIVRNCIEKKFKVLRSNITERIEKMKKRGWTQEPTEFQIVLPGQTPITLVEEIKQDPDDSLYKMVVQYFKPLLDQGKKIVRICQLSSSAWDKIYQGHAEMIALENNGDANEKKLFHGTTKEGADGITQGNFDNRYFSDGAWGRAAYFAEALDKSQFFAEKELGPIKTVFLCRVLCGKQEVRNQEDPSIVAPAKGCHSVCGHGHHLRGTPEHMIFRFGQAKPFIMFQYK